jgi:hypothetical protein
MDNINKIIKKHILNEAAGVSFYVRDWSKIVFNLLNELPNNENRLIVDGYDYPEEFKNFSFDYLVIDYNDWTNGYLDESSGYDKDGNYVVHIMVLNKFRNHPYMQTILNHELKHAYQDWQRISKGYKGVSDSKESKEIYTADFIKVVKDKINVGRFFKDILIKYYLLTDLEFDAFMENVYDKDKINDYKSMVKNVSNFDALKSIQYQDPDELESNWVKLQSLNLPFIKKYKTYIDFLKYSDDYFKTKSEKILKKINKLEYVHRDR